MWFLIIYTTMAVGSQRNGQIAFLLAKIVTSACLVTWFMREPWLLETIFEILRQACGIHWSAREWAFRVNLDLWIVYTGMIAALAVIKIREYRLTEHQHWPLVYKVSIGISSVAILWFFAFELYQESKFTYNHWHPYISSIPVLAFIVLRNANVVLRSTFSPVFAFIGRCSLETFVIQYHLWLAGDTKGVLLVVPGTRWRPINFLITTAMFVYVSDRMADATTDITSWICGKTSNTLPTTTTMTVPPTSIPTPDTTPQPDIPLSDVEQPSKHGENSDELLSETEALTEGRRWIDRLAETLPPRPHSHTLWEKPWRPGLNTRLAIVVGVMWITNIFWAH